MIYLRDNLRQLILLGRRLGRGSFLLGVGLDSAVRIHGADRAVRLGQDTSTLFDQWLDVLDDLLLVELVLGRSIGRVKALV